jgi:COP9 signalosome complex subunit 5
MIIFVVTAVRTLNLTSNSICCSPHFFKDIKISALALLKMVMHARSGGTLEVMGLLLGKVDANTMMVMDSFALPVEGTETRVNAQAQAYEYMTAYIEAAKQVTCACCMFLVS